MLHRLGEDIPRSGGGEGPDFHDHVRLVTGASGGMVGAAHYLAWRKQVLDNRGHTDDAWVRTMPTENLPEVASHIALVGVVQSLFPRLPRTLAYDRGQALESQWPSLRTRFIDHRKGVKGEESGALPSLVFTPVTVDDGRRLIISNLGLHPIAVNSGDEIDVHRKDRAKGLAVYSVAAPEFYRVFGKHADELTLATAARMSATFPMVSPAVNLPTEPPIRVVDAGYYDNYGVNIAVAWLFRNREWLRRNTSGVALVQIQAFMGRHQRLGLPEASGESIGDGVQFFSTPFAAFAGMRESMPMFRNDEEVAALAETFTRESSRSDFFTTIIFENSAQVLLTRENGSFWPLKNADQRADAAPFVTDVAMTWYLSELEKRSMDDAIPDDAVAKHWKLIGIDLQEVTESDREKNKDTLFDRPADRLRWLSTATANYHVQSGPTLAVRKAFVVKEARARPQLRADPGVESVVAQVERPMTRWLRKVHLFGVKVHLFGPGRPGWLPTQVPGSRGALLLPSPLRTTRKPFGLCRSSLSQGSLRNPVGHKCTTCTILVWS